MRLGRAVDTATDYGLDDRWVEVRYPVRSKFSLFHIARSTKSHIEWVLGGKAAEREAYHSPPTGTEIKKTWIHTCTPPTYLWLSD
jgi:hypothetical protein